MVKMRGLTLTVSPKVPSGKLSKLEPCCSYISCSSSLVTVGITHPLCWITICVALFSLRNRLKSNNLFQKARVGHLRWFSPACHYHLVGPTKKIYTGTVAQLFEVWLLFGGPAVVYVSPLDLCYWAFPKVSGAVRKVRFRCFTSIWEAYWGSSRHLGIVVSYFSVTSLSRHISGLSVTENVSPSKAFVVHPAFWESSFSSTSTKFSSANAPSRIRPLTFFVRLPYSRTHALTFSAVTFD